MIPPAEQPGANRLLIVDDDRGLRQILGWHLEDLGYRVVTAGDFYEALWLVSREPIGFALLDQHLPDGNGLDLLRSILHLQPHTRVVLMSGESSDGAHQSALSRGQWIFWTSPCRWPGSKHFSPGALPRRKPAPEIKHPK